MTSQWSNLAVTSIDLDRQLNDFTHIFSSHITRREMPRAIVRIFTKRDMPLGYARYKLYRLIMTWVQWLVGGIPANLTALWMTTDMAWLSLILFTRPLVSPSIIQNRFVSKKNAQNNKFLNQYQACLYLFECISYGDSKYSHWIQEFGHFWTFCGMFDYGRLLTPAAWKRL